MMRRLSWMALKRCTVILFVVLILGPCATMVRAEEEERPTASLYVDILNQYIWRGYALSNSDAVIQPSVTASYKGFSLNIWGNLDTNDKNPVYPAKGEPFPNSVNWNETDFTLSYTHELYKGLSGTVGTVYYSFDNADDSWEIYAGLSYALPWFTVAVTGYREASHYPGWWMQIDLTRNFKLPWCGMSVDAGTSFFYQSSEDQGAFPNPDGSGAYSGWLSGVLGVGLNIPVGKYVTITPKIGYAYPLGGEASDMIKFVSWDGNSDHVFGGLRISAAF